ncbi:hypothetical protein CEXT_306151 [Caerostris extrusa]|uniref:Uncharacterized protein n=1 Tax=Caerostris extrusa TaxID=172846 RepID=A0AAV4W5L6_CAEEX|nr:hypothetical protein CEXT_306151 [Caerostris extrusa]
MSKGFAELTNYVTQSSRRSLFPHHANINSFLPAPLLTRATDYGCHKTPMGIVQHTQYYIIHFIFLLYNPPEWLLKRKPIPNTSAYGSRERAKRRLSARRPFHLSQGAPAGGSKRNSIKLTLTRPRSTFEK